MADDQIQEWTPTWKPEEEDEGVVSKVWKNINTPLVDVSPQTKAAMENFTKEHPYLGRVGQTAVGTMTGMSSPLALGLEAGTLGAAGLASPLAARGLGAVGKVLGAGAVAHGGYNAIQNIQKGNYPEAFGNALEMGIGGLGFMGGKKPLKTVEPLPPPIEEAIPLSQKPVPKVPLGLNPAPPHIANPPNYIAGPTGRVAPFNMVDPSLAAHIADMGTEGHVPTSPAAGQAFDPAVIAEQNRIKNLNYNAAQQFPGSRLVLPDKQLPIPPVSGDTRGGFQPQTNSPMGYPYNVLPDVVRPRAAQSEVLGSTGLKGMNLTPPPESKPVSFSNAPAPKPVPTPEPIAYYGTGTARPNEPQLPSAVKTKPVEPIKPPTPETENIVNAETIPPKTNPKQAVQDWANGRTAANQYGRNAAKDFADLDDPELVAKYQAGDRTGKLADVQTHLDTLRKAEVDAGVLPEDAVKANYLRQYWEQTPEEVDKIFAGIVSKNPGFAKESVFKTYEQGIDAGLTPKFTTLPEILEARTAEGVRAIKNKQFYDYLVDNGKIKEGATIPDTQNIDKVKKIFKDPEDADSKKLIQYMTNYLGDSNPKIKAAADVASMTKNIYLGGGVPGTKYNMHAWNTAKSDAKLRGFAEAAKDFFTDPTGKKAGQLFDDKGNRDLLAKFMEKGYTFHPVEDTGAELSGSMPTKVGKKILETTQNVFEKPLFERALPATKFKGTEYAYNKLKSGGMEDDAAMRAAVNIGNEMYGGINKSIRDKTISDTTRVLALAPDWLESRVRLALDDWKGAVKTVAGKGNEVDKLHAKSFARGAAMTGAAMGAGGLANRRPQDVTSVPIGEDAKGKSRMIDVLGTSDEGMRIPIQTAMKGMEGNPGAALDLLAGNRISLPAHSVWNLATGKDSFGNAIRGTDKYGKQIPGSVSALKHLNEATKPFQYQGVQGFVDYMRDNASGEEAASRALELPLKYVSNPKPKGFQKLR